MKNTIQNIPASSSRQKPAPISLIAQWAEMIKLEHTVFALPFALSGLLLASNSIPGVTVFFWTIVAFAGARAAAMTLNRLIDAQIDALNPRTKTRAIPAGIISRKQAFIFTLISFSIMLFAAAQLPPICLWLSPIAIFWLSFYSYTKRFTWLCHIVLGIALGGAALGGWVAAGGALTSAPPWIFACAVASWVAGFDIIYALQDKEFDREHKLYSIPARFGIEQALAISSGLHVVTAACLVAVGCLLSLGQIYWSGAVLVTTMLVYEHKLVKPDDLSKINAAFFNTNGIVSICTFVAVLLDRITH